VYKLYEFQGIAGCLATFLFAGPIGKLSDLVSPKTFLPIMFLARSLNFFLAFKINDPNKLPFYVIAPMLHVTFHFVNMSYQAYLTKMYPGEIRGMMTSVQSISATLSMVVFLNVCNSLNKHDSKYPFMAISIIDAFTSVLLVILASVGFFGEPYEAIYLKKTSVSEMRQPSDTIVNIDNLGLLEQQN
jgi:hypothetical protein